MHYILDSLYLEEIYGFKRTCFSKEICKVGIPVNSIEKYIKSFKENNIGFRVFDYTDSNNYIYKFKDNKYHLRYYYELVNDYSLLIKNCNNKSKCKKSNFVNLDKYSSLDLNKLKSDLNNILNNIEIGKLIGSYIKSIGINNSICLRKFLYIFV